jgi:hypothetical protein
MANPQDKQTVDNLGEAISVLVQAVNIAQAKGGVYTFADAAKINSALIFVDALAQSQNGETEAKGPKSSPAAEVMTQEVDSTAKK